MTEESIRPGVDASQAPALAVKSLAELQALYGLPAQSVGNLWTGNKWGDALGEGVVLSTSFSVEGVSAFNYGSQDVRSKVTTFNDKQVQAAWEAMNAWSAVGQIRFMEVADTGESAGDIRWTSSTSAQVYANAHMPDFAASGGDVWFGVRRPEFIDPVLGGVGGFAFLHELGHALGLEHPHDSRTFMRPVLGEDQLKYSVMSYSDTDWLPWWKSGGYQSTSFPITPMLNDIAAIQWLYGANMEHATGDNVYRWKASAAVFETIWDAGGEDVIDASNQREAVVINLNAGAWSTMGVGYWVQDVLIRDTLAIAYGAVIEHAVGSAFDDTLLGNEVGNRLEGGAGDDTLRGGLGDDTLKGGSGSDLINGGQGVDWAWFSDAPGGIEVRLWRDRVVHDGHGGVDTIVGVENIRGSAHNDWISGDKHDNRLEGGAGDDTLRGGSGNDTLVGGAGNDALHGGPGFDIVDHSLAAGGIKVKLWKQRAEDDGDGGQDTLVSIEGIVGSAFDDFIAGDRFDNVLLGGAGNDTLRGGSGNDTLEGGTGSNVLDGGAGDDTLYLNDGINWVAVWTGGGQDTVHGFSAAKGDVLALGFDLNGSGITTTEQALAAAQQMGSDVVVDVGAGQQVTLVGVQLADLGLDAFVVV